MSLPADTPPAVADALGYLQHHLQELTECQNALEHIINNTLAGLTAQIQQLTQLMTGPAPAVTPYKHLGKISDILHLNNENNQLERRAQPPKIFL